MSVIIKRAEGGFVAEEELCATADGRLCGVDDPEAHVVVAGKGAVIPQSMVDRYHITESKAKVAEKPEPKAEQPQHGVKRAH